MLTQGGLPGKLEAIAVSLVFIVNDQVEGLPAPGDRGALLQNHNGYRGHVGTVIQHGRFDTTRRKNQETGKKQTGELCFG